MARPKSNHPKTSRLQIPCTTEQLAIISSAVQRSGASHMSTWALAQLLRAANRVNDDAGSGPLVLPQVLSDRLRTIAAAQGVSPERALELLAEAA